MTWTLLPGRSQKWQQQLGQCQEILDPIVLAIRRCDKRRRSTMTHGIGDLVSRHGDAKQAKAAQVRRTFTRRMHFSPKNNNLTWPSC